MGKGKKQKSKKTKNQTQQHSMEEGWAHIDPERIRFQHSKIRPFFSGCGRSVEETLMSIRRGELKPSELPPIQVIVGPDENDGLGPWYFTLNNRRAWVLKRCREDGILENNRIKVRVREAKSSNERDRYSLKNCAADAKFMREQASITKISHDTQKMAINSDDGFTDKSKNGEAHSDEDKTAQDSSREVCNDVHSDQIGTGSVATEERSNTGDSEESSSEDEAPEQPYKNRFCFGDDSSDSSDDSD